MFGSAHATREERLSNIRASLARVYYPEPVKLSEQMKEQIRTLKNDPADHENGPH